MKRLLASLSESSVDLNSPTSTRQAPFRQISESYIRHFLDDSA
jgi:hypothetical protein